VDPLGQLGRRRRPLDPGQLGRHLVAPEPVQLQPLDPAAPVQLGQERPQRVAAVQLVGPVGHDQQQPPVPQIPVKEGQQVPGGAVRPVQVLDDQHGRPLGPQPLQQHQQQLEQPPLVRPQPEPTRAQPGTSRSGAGSPAGVQLGEETGQLDPCPARDQLGQLGLVQVAQERPQGLDQGGERHPLAAQLDAAADQHGRPGLPGRGDQLTDQTGLADPGLAAEQHRRRGPGGGPVRGRGQPGQLLGPADEGRAGERRRHGHEYGAAGLGSERAGGWAGSSLPVGDHGHGRSS
jgi:hypothetical protein